MLLLDTAKTHSKSILAIGSTAIAVALIFSAFTSASGAGGNSQQETVYRESTVQRGDITVGVTETATATLKNNSLSFDIAGTVEEVFVKAGQSVKEGDPIAAISIDSIEDTIDDLTTDYQETSIKLSDAKLSQQKGELEAKLSKDSTVTGGDNADTTYEMSIYKLERALADAEKDVAEIQKEIKTYNLILGYSFWDSVDEDEIDWDEYDSYNSKYDKDFKDEDEVKDARSDAYDRLESAEANIKEATYNLEVQSSEAILTKDKSTLNAEMAEQVYQMELQSLANTVATRELELSNISKELEEARASLEDNILYAPCDGVVTTVNVSEGDEMQAKAEIAAISDSDNVFVYIAVAQDDITGVSMGQECTVVMDAFEEITFAGTVDSITTTPVRNASGSASYNVSIKLDGDIAQVYEGMTGTATLITRQQKDVLYVTNRTVYERDGQSYVKVKIEDESIQEVPVKTGFSDGRNVEITEGLTQGQTVLIESQVAAQQ